jgi:hypothetical protein
VIEDKANPAHGVVKNYPVLSEAPLRKTPAAIE